MGSIENLFKKTFTEKEKNTTKTNQNKNIPIKNNQKMQNN